MRSIFAAVFLFAAPSLASLASRPADEITSSTPMEGLYAGLAGGGALIIIDTGNAFGYDVEGRLGYSFNPGLQVYLSGSVDGAPIRGPVGNSFRSEIVAAFVQYHLYARPSVGVYARAGIGVALSSSYAQSAVGLAASGGLGIEIGFSPHLFLAPEVFYKNANLSLSNGGGTVAEQVVGLQLGLIFY
jgi:hypothetical protein